MILEYGNLMRRIVDTKYRQVCELQRTHKPRTAREADNSTGKHGRDSEARGLPPPHPRVLAWSGYALLGRPVLGVSVSAL